MNLNKFFMTVVLLIATTAWASDIDDAYAAIDRKEYATAVMKFKSAAQKIMLTLKSKLDICTAKGLVLRKTTLKQYVGIDWQQRKGLLFRSSTSVCCTAGDEV